MADYTLTPNLGLYKPSPNSDDDAWGSHLNANADTLDSAVLRLTGGTVTGPTTFSAPLTVNGSFISSGNNYAFADAASHTALYVTPLGNSANPLTIYSGGSTGQSVQFRSPGPMTLEPGWGGIGGVGITTNPTYAGSTWYELFGVSAILAGATTATQTTNVIHHQFVDTVDASGSTLNLINYFQLDAQFGGAAKGYRHGLSASITLNTALTSPGANYVGVVGAASASASAGGTGLTLATCAGGIFGANFYTSTIGTAQNIGGVVGIEVNPAIGTGTTAVVLTGIQVVPTGIHAVRGAAHWDVGYLLASQTGAQGIDLGYVVGGSYGGAQWPIRSDGSLFRGALGYSGGASALNGVMLNEVSFPTFGAGPRGGAFVSNGFAVDGAGTIQCGPGYITPSAGGLVADVKGSFGTGTPTVAAGGSGYRVNDVLYDPYGGVYIVSTVSGTAVTAVTVRAGTYGEPHQPLYPTHTTPTNPVATTTWIWATGGSGCTLNLTWNTTGTTLALQPSAGATTVGGVLTVAGQTTMGTVGFNNTNPIAKPTGWGAPTGTATRTTFVTGSVTLPALAEHVKALIDDLTAYGLIGP